MSLRPQRHYSLDEYFAVEDTSPLKHEYDRGEKFDLCKGIASLKEYLLVEQSMVRLERFRLDRSGWSVDLYSDLDVTIELTSVTAKLSLRKVYREVFPPSAGS